MLSLKDFLANDDQHPVITHNAGNLKPQRLLLNSAGVFWIDACSKPRLSRICPGLINCNCLRQQGVWPIVRAMTQNFAADCVINNSVATTPIGAVCASGMGSSFRLWKRHHHSSQVWRHLRRRPG